MNGLVTTTQYDALCRPRKVTTPSGAFACTNYLNLGTPTTQHIETQTVPPAPDAPAACDAATFTAGANLWSRSYLDGFGRTYRAAAEGPGGTQTAIEALTAYNERGTVKSATAPFYVNGATPDPQFTTTWKYDALDRKIEKRHPDDRFVQGSYGLSTLAAGFEKAMVIDERGTATAANDRIATVHTDAFGRTIRIDRLADPVAGTTVSTNYQYDLLDRLVGLTDHAGNQWTYSYDSLGRRTRVVDPDLGTWNYVYDAAGRLTDQTDAKGQVTRLTYDALGRVLTKTAKYGTAQADTTTFSYDQARTGYFNVGHQTTAANAAATIVYNFDNEGRQVAQTYTLPGVTPSTYSFTTAYDSGGRVLGQTYPDGDTVGGGATPLTYDAAGRLKTVPNLVSNIIYDARGNQTNVTRPNGVSTVMGWSAERGWLTSLVTSGTAGTVQDLTYARDELGRITGVASPLAGDGWTYGYDDLDRLLSADNATDNTLDQSFTYDLVGNMLTNSKVGTYAYPAQGPGSVRPHAVTGISGGPLGAQSFTYDANGSMTVQGPDTRSYDGENRLVSATDGGVATSFVYGPDGARLKKIAGGVTTIYFGDDVEVTPGATPQYTKYLPGDAKRVGLSTTTWLHRDHLQSVRALTSSTGAILDRATYRPFGEQQGFATVTESKGYIGQRNDTETGLMYLHARYYDPVLARFVQADPMDPIEPGVGVNRYAYAGNNPITYLDPSGLHDEPDDPDHHMQNAERQLRDRADKAQKRLDDLEDLYNTARNHGLTEFADDILDNPAVDRASVDLMDAEAELAALREDDYEDTVQRNREAFIAAFGVNEEAADPRNPNNQATEVAIIAGALAAVLDAMGEDEDAERVRQKADQLRANKIKGDDFRDKVAAELERRGYTVRKEVTRTNPLGRRTYDLVVFKNGVEIGCVECKTGNSPYKPHQRAYDAMERILKGTKVNVIRGR